MLFGFHPEKALANAERLVQQGKFAPAIDIYEKLISQQPAILSLKNNLGDLYVQVGRTQEAIELFEQVADHLEREGLYSRALAVMRKMLKLNSGQLELQRRIARVLSEQGMIGEARGVWLDLLDRAEQSGNWTLAEECAKRLLVSEPESLNLLARVAQVRKSRGDQAGAKPEWLSLGRKAIERGASDRLETALRELEAIDPEWLPYRMLRARAEAMRGNPADALTLLPPDEALRQDAGMASEAWRIAVETEDLPRAKRLARIAMEAGDASVAVAMGRELLKQGELADVVDWATTQPEWFHRADLRGGWCTLLDDLLEIDPNHRRALQAWLELASEGDAAAPALAPRRQRLAELLRESGDAAAALEQYRKVAQLSSASDAVKGIIRELEAELGLAAAAPVEEPAKSAGTAAAADFAVEVASFPGLVSAPLTSTPADGSVLDLDDEWAQVADQDLEESIRQIEFFSQNGMLPVAREILDGEMARLPHEPRLQALDVVLRTRMAAAAESAAPGGAAGTPEFVLSPVPSGENDNAAPTAAGLDWMTGTAAPVSAEGERTTSAAAAAAAGAGRMEAGKGHEALLQDVLPEAADSVSGAPADAAWTDWLQGDAAAAPDATKPGAKGKGGEAARLFDDLFDNFRIKVEGAGADAASDPEQQYNMGIAYHDMGLFEEAVAELQKSFLGWEGQKQPPRDRLLSCGSTIALCFQQINMPEMALTWYRRTVEAARLPVSESIGLLYEEGRLLEQLGRRNEALECYRQVYATDIDYQDVAECLKRVQAMAPPVA